MENETTSKEDEQPDPQKGSRDNAPEVAQKIIAKKAEAEEGGDARYLRLMAEFRTIRSELQRRSPIYILMQMKRCN